ncbi:hypothetical protein QBC36DRAFT_391067 [Triangularia setosa]|uniref:Gamma-glutamylcyclotransferase AIG2-like domain-containing protein n=1 Tax=Triangularia setosa TaxID=2587417 RepID=A0AAN6VZP1_9PEZI|nr:hypothetical protein QBC36DRAFT_391067 [Podospora setosa]
MEHEENPFLALESWSQLAGHPTKQTAVDEEPDKRIVQRCGTLFSYTASKAMMIDTEKEAGGYDKEAYEHALWLAQSALTTVSTTDPRQRKKIIAKPQAYLLKLGHPSLEQNVKTGQSTFKPTFIIHFVAENNLCSISAHPTLDIASTLPQHWPNSADNQYPVFFYFVYGTLANPQILKEKLDLDKKPVYKPAHKALIDAPPQLDHNKAIIDGYAFTVENSMQEDALCGYETGKYEVVRCTIELPEEGQVVEGLTFRFVGETS